VKGAFPFSFKRLLSKIRTDDLTLEEITAQVGTQSGRKECDGGYNRVP